MAFNADIKDIRSQLQILSSAIQGLIGRESEVSAASKEKRNRSHASSSALSDLPSTKSKKKPFNKRYEEVSLFLSGEESYNRLRSAIQRHSKHVVSMQDGLMYAFMFIFNI